MAQIEIKNLTFSYPNSQKNALNSINLSIEKGEYVLLCGQSGSGKSTLLRHMKTVLTPFGKRTGSIFFHGAPLSGCSPRLQAEKIGFVMQNPDSQIVTDKVWHELAFGLENLGCDQKNMQLRVAEMAHFFGIQDWFHREVCELSGGQKQLLNLASVMVMQPEILILDEPTSQLDPIAASDFLATIRKINLELGTTILITEHRTEEIFSSANRVVIMEQGTITANDTPDKVGQQLFAGQSPLFSEIPTPSRVFYGSGETGSCPLTVREGRKWLETKKAERGEYPCQREVGGTSPVIEMTGVFFRYEKDGKDVLRDLTFSLASGIFHAIMGGNGTGKSTTLKTICGIAKPYRGTVKVLGKPIGKYKAGSLFDNCLAMLPQDPQSLFVTDSVKEELEEMGASPDAMDNTASVCGITHLMNCHPCDLSGGEQQRVALAKVLLTKPKILLLDEPTKGLDGDFKKRFADLIRRLIAQGMTVLMVSHDVEFCAEYTDAVSMFFDGRVLTTDTPRRFFSGNSFYTTSASRMSRGILPGAVTAGDILYALGKEEGNG